VRCPRRGAERRREERGSFSEKESDRGREGGREQREEGMRENQESWKRKGGGVGEIERAAFSACTDIC
jgi:hypothetical protein